MSTQTPQPGAASEKVFDRADWAIDADPLLLLAAVNRVLGECDRCERGGTFMAPEIVRDLIARELGVTR